MKILSSSRSIAVLTLALAAMVFTSCQSTTPRQAARQLDRATYTEVLGFNGAMAPQSRQYVSYGALPEKVRTAMNEYMRYGEWKTVEYARPQYYVIVDNACWAICADTQGRMTGIMALRGTKKNVMSKASDARLRQATGSYKLVYNDTPDGTNLAYEIMKGLEPADAYRKSVRKRLGLDTPVVTTPPPAPRPRTTTTTSIPATTATPAAQEPAVTETPAEDGDGIDTGVVTDDITTDEEPATDEDATAPVVAPGVEETPAPATDPLEETVE